MGGKKLSRREFLKVAGIGLAAGLAGCAPQATPTPTPKPAAEEKPTAPAVVKQRTNELKILAWSHFVPRWNEWLDNFAKEWGEKNGVKVTVDHIHQMDMAARGAAQVAAQTGHDIFQWDFGTSSPYLWKNHMVDLTDFINKIEQKYGPFSDIGRQAGFDPETGQWFALPIFFVRFPQIYRKDLWDEIVGKSPPDTWEDVLEGGRKLKAKGYPIGIGLAHSSDPNDTWRGLIWSFGGSIQDEEGNVVINSKETVEAVKFARALYKECMTEEVLAWDDASNNRFLASGKGSWISNPISAYRSIQKSDPELAKNIYVWKTPAGPVRRLVVGVLHAFTVWKFAKNIENALAFLEAYIENYQAAFEASEGYNHPTNPHLLPSPMPILSNDPTSDPPDKLSILQTADEWSAAFGWPGPNSPAIGEVVQTYIIPDMMAKAATDELTPEEAVAWAEEQIQRIFKKWQALMPAYRVRV